MNYIWCAMVLVSFVCAAANGTVNETAAAIAEGAAAAIETVLSFAGIMCFWCGIMRVAEDAGAVAALQKIISPVTKFLFPRANDEARRYISLNVTANVLGLGNAATPAGIRAMEALDKTNAEPSKPSYEMCMFLVLNTTSFQLVPTTIMSLRAAAGGDAAAVIAPVWITSAVSVAAAVTAVKLFCKNGGARSKL
ncbi:MAG: spore maturation protein [Firmicutes bacterium]|nr:spore maturation protein [Bacillota bacterium]